MEKDCDTGGLFMSKGGLGELGMDGASLRNSLTSYFFLSNSVGGKYELRAGGAYWSRRVWAFG